MIVFVYGTRPEVIKIGPVLQEMSKTSNANYAVVCTGQHTDLLQGMPYEDHFNKALSLDLPATANISHWLMEARKSLRVAYTKLQPQLVVVQGDTMSAYAGAMAAVDERIPFAHIEAGVRSHDIHEPAPEEQFRSIIDRFASLCLCPTEVSFDNLQRQFRDPITKPCLGGVNQWPRITITGNTVVTALEHSMAGRSMDSPLPFPYSIITLHRREWRESGNFLPVCHAMADEAINHFDHEFIWPMHPAVRNALGGSVDSGAKNLRVFEPMDRQRFLRYLNNASGVITDSGGVVEEAITLGVPTAILRNVNDRPEAYRTGICSLFPPTAEGVSAAFEWLRRSTFPPRQRHWVFGNPDAARRVTDELIGFRS